MNNDNKIDATDVANASDLNGDTVVDSADVDIILEQWGLDLSPWLVA